MTYSSLVQLLPVLVAVLALALSVAKHTQHKLLSELLEEALRLESEREQGASLVTLLNEACKSQAEKDLVEALGVKIAARIADKA